MKKKDNKSNEAIDSKELILAMDELEKEKGIKKDYLMESIETALVTAYKREFEAPEESEVKITMDRETGEIHVYTDKTVVKKVKDDKTEIMLQDAQKISKALEIGDVAQVEVVPKNFGRIAAGTAKQVIIQKIREASRDVLFNEFSDRKGEIVSGIIQKADGGIVVADLGKLEGVMPLKEQIVTENYRVNDKIRAYIVDVERGMKGAPQVIISRAHCDFVRKLFELEIPEIYEGVIEIKSVSRDAGNRSKVAVYSPNENIDPVGSCVGQKGIRIQNIINELGGEKIDVIEWNEDPSIFISAALLPAQVLAVDVKEEERFAQVIVPDDQLSLAIGKSGQNARLAAKLTNWKIDIKSESQFRKMLLEAEEGVEEESQDYIEPEILDMKIEEVVEKEEKAKKITKKTTTKKSTKIEEDEKPKKTTKKATKADEEKTKKVTKKSDKTEVEPKKVTKKSETNTEKKPKKSAKVKSESENDEKPKKATKKSVKTESKEKEEKKPKKVTKAKKSE